MSAQDGGALQIRNQSVPMLLVVVLVVIMFVAGAETAYLLGSVSPRTTTVVTSIVSTVFAPSLTLENFVLCSPATCGVHAASLSGTVILGAGTPIMTSIHLYINGTDEGITYCGAAGGCQVYDSRGIVFFQKYGIGKPLIVSGYQYPIEFVVTFQGNLTTTAYDDLVAQ